MSFFEVYQDLQLSKDDLNKIYCPDKKKIQEILSKDNSYCLDSLLYLLSPAANSLLEELAQKSQKITFSRFGKIINLYAPIYLSNECTNTCTYCGFSMENKIPRKTLSQEEFKKEIDYLYKKGFRSILLVAGEHQKIVSVEYICQILKECKNFSSISIEFAPFSEEAYKKFSISGVNGLTIYQETYNQDIYKTVHLKGKKQNFQWRLESPERGAKAKMRKINLGILLGLNKNWQEECWFLAHHIKYLMKNFWEIAYSVSFPRICESETQFGAQTIDDKVFVQIILAFRIVFPDLGINLSTRESPNIRNGLIGLGITEISAESSTQPGGYTHKEKELEQFSTTDKRSLEEITQVFKEKNCELVYKNWEYGLHG